MAGNGTTARRDATLGHTCLTYDDPADFDTAARAFLAAGHAAGQQTWYVGNGKPQGWEFTPEVLAVAAHYPAGSVIDPEAGLAAYAEATDRARAEGYTGLCVAADATALVRTPAQLEAFARYEFLVDRYMRDHPFTAMCAFDRGELGADVTTELACAHPDSQAPFRLYADRPDRSGAALAGELDADTLTWFEHTLQRCDLAPAGGELRLDGSALTFIDHQSLLSLDRYARGLGATAVLRTPFASARRMAELLELTAVRVKDMS
ncbi:MEDS domain-containing protein [Symbioplanes lichenis]|uniref:MEDS domain-containing protein n=1 Tax=Symbioplanes lichenis TaxID=1629072 RepID=UPI0027383628|nr:MEDS domain-containing protein [Actinoplanes lichenis]